MTFFNFKEKTTQKCLQAFQAQCALAVRYLHEISQTHNFPAIHFNFALFFFCF